MENCWEMIGCGREIGGEKVEELGICPAAEMGMGHSCWAIAGTLCGGEVQGTQADKLGTCQICQVFNRYERLRGLNGKEISDLYPEEEARYRKILHQRFQKMIHK